MIVTDLTWRPEANGEGHMSRFMFVGILLVALLSQGGGAGAQASARAAGNQAPETVIIILSTPCSQGTTSTAPNESCPAQAPVLAQLQAAGATVISTTTLVD